MGDLVDRLRDNWVRVVVAVAAVTAIVAGGVWLVLGSGDDVEQTDEPAAVVTRDSDGRIVITNREELEFSLSFPLPQNCEESKVTLRDYIDRYPDRSDMPGDDQSTYAVLDRIAQDLCSYRDYRDFLVEEFEPWVQMASAASQTGG